MATYRIGIGSFSLAENGGVGIGTDSAGLGNLKVEGTVKTTDLDVTGVSTFTRYAGFAADELSISRDVSLTGEHQSTGDIVVGLNSTFTVSTGSTVTVGAVESVSIGTHFSPPIGDINDRPEVPVEGTVRFNTDLNTLEFYNGAEWRQFTVYGVGGRSQAYISGGFGALNTPAMSTIQYFDMTTLGNAEYFGQLTDDAVPDDSCASTTRVVNHHGIKAGISNIIDYFTTSTTGNAADFGDISSARFRSSCVSSQTRGIFVGGRVPTAVNVIDYVEISTIGSATDFGDLATPVQGNVSASSPTRGVIFGGVSTPSSPIYIPDLSYITIASKGDAKVFAECSFAGGYGDACSNNIRAVFGGGYAHEGPHRTTRIAAQTMASLANAFEFGELNVSKAWLWSAGNQTRGCFGGGNAFPGSNHYNVMEYLSMSSGGRVLDFGDMTEGAYGSGAITNAHGGLGGY